MNGFGPDFSHNGGPNVSVGGIEFIDVLFALTNVRVVKDLVEESLWQIEQLGDVSKGQTEGLRQMMLQKQRALLSDITSVENTLSSIVEIGRDSNIRKAGGKTYSLNPEQTKVLVESIKFAISHMAKFLQQGQSSDANPGDRPI